MNGYNNFQGTETTIVMSSQTYAFKADNFFHYNGINSRVQRITENGYKCRFGVVVSLNKQAALKYLASANIPYEAVL
ncbi:MAG: hypothetical protein LBM93_08995 [Oscillospiraceae bacterium]|jgi:hypothetical protein|nr:hypothetical protein [Oscillospiraceae bacterium]